MKQRLTAMLLALALLCALLTACAQDDEPAAGETVSESTGETASESSDEETVPGTEDETVSEPSDETLPDAEETTAASTGDKIVSGAYDDHLTWTFNETTGVLTISGEGEMEVIGEPYFEYYPWSPYQSSIRTVVINEGVTSIGCLAFEGCASLTSITIPNSVTSIDERAFYQTGYYNDASNWTDGALYIGNNLIEVKDVSGTYSVKAGTRAIADGAFYTIKTPFSVVLPSSLTCFAARSFYLCSGLTNISVDANNPVFDSRNDCGAIIETATGTLLLGCRNTVIPNGVTRVGKWAFRGCSELKEITIPDSVTSIGECAFGYCYALTDITLPDSVTRIDADAFVICTGLTSITVPDGVTKISEEAFCQCTGLTSVTIPNSVTAIGDFTFFRCLALTDVYFLGTEEEWNAITIGEYNESLTGATIHFAEN